MKSFSDKVHVAVISPSRDICAHLCEMVQKISLASVELELNQYCTARGDRSTHDIYAQKPQVVLIDISDLTSALQSIDILHSVLPESWIFVSGENPNAQTVIDCMHAGAREFLLRPVQSFELELAFKRYIREHRDQGAIHCVIGPKEGVGATSIAINLAYATADLPNAYVSLIDLNSPMTDVTEYLMILKPEATIEEALSTSQLNKEQIKEFMTEKDRIEVLAASRKYPSQFLDPHAFAELLQACMQRYTHTFIDCPATIDKGILRILMTYCESILFVLTPEWPSLWRSEKLLETLGAIIEGESAEPGSENYRAELNEKIRLVLNRTTRSDDCTQKEIEDKLHKSIYFKIPNDYRAAINAIKDGVPLAKSGNKDGSLRKNSSSALASAYIKFAQELSGNPKQNSSLIARIFNSSGGR
jgi:pilus assembly protein CpaE